jgi:uncharacterized protein YcfL
MKKWICLITIIVLLTGCGAKKVTSVPEEFDKQIWNESIEVFNIIDNHLQSDKDLSDNENKILNAYSDKYIDKYFFKTDNSNATEEGKLAYNLVVAINRTQDYFVYKSQYRDDDALKNKQEAGKIIYDIKQKFK